MNVLSRLLGYLRHKTATNTITMAEIAGLSEQQCAALQGIQVGDLVFVQKVMAQIPSQDDSDSDSEDEDNEDEEDEEGVEEDSGEESQDNGDDEQDEDEQQDEDGEAASAMDDSSSEIETRDDDSSSDTNNTSSNTSLSETYVAPRLYVVSQITTDSNGKIVDLHLSHLQYAHQTTGDTTHAYYIHGKNVIHQHPATCAEDCANSASITDIVTDENFRLTVKPAGDTVRYTESTFRAANPHTRCIASCADGWLQSMQDLVDMIPNYDPPVLSLGVPIPASLQPTVCPVCIGDELCKKQQQLQATFMLTSVADVGATIEFVGELNLRRTNELGYTFMQYDEREWGMYFEDMMNEDGESEEGDDDDDRFEHWAEAMDPSSVSVATRPASATTIASLPRKTFAEAELPEGTECQVCKGDLEEDAILAELPCGHVHFHEDCIATWLLHFDTCATCRKQVPAVAEPEVDADSEPEMEDPDENVEAVVDGEDTVMSDE